MEPASRTAPSGLPTAHSAVLLAAALLVVWELFAELTVLILALLLTVIVAIPLTAATDWLNARRVPRPVGAGITLLLALGALGTAVALLVPMFAEQAAQAVDDLPVVVEQLRSELNGIVGGRPGELGASAQSFVEGYLENPLRLIGRVTNVLTGVVALLGGAALVLLAALFIAINPQPLVSGLVALAPPSQRERALHIMNRLRRDWLGWLKGVAIDMVLTGALTYIGLSLLGLDYALVFAVLTGLLEFVPYFGPVVAAVPPVLFALTQSVELALLTLALYTAIQQIEGNLIVPLVMAQTVRLHPALLAFGVVVIGSLFGFMGLLLAVPILSATVVLTQELWVRPKEDAARGTPAA